MHSLDIRGLTEADAGVLSEMLLAASPEYQRYFVPFAFDVETIRRIVAAAKADRYWGLFVGPTLAGFFMLRGFDQHYDVPSYGVSIAEAFSRRGLLGLSLAYANAWCRLNGATSMMLKVHPDNMVAKAAYERAGFTFARTEPSSGQLVYYRDLR